MVSFLIPTFANNIIYMPEVFTLFGYRFFWSKEHEPIHIHVEGNDGYAVFDLDNTTCTFIERECQNIKAKDKKKITNAIEERKQEIINKWNEHFNQ